MTPEEQNENRVLILGKITSAIDAHLPKDCGFVVMFFQTGDPDRRLTYSSNIPRSEGIRIVKEWLKHHGVKENWMKDIE